MLEDLLSPTSAHSVQFLELCNALYERELRVVAIQQQASIEQMQSRLKSLPYYVKRTAGKMLKAESPLLLDLQNASWSMNQSRALPIKEQRLEDVQQWYSQNIAVPGLIVPVLVKHQQSQRIILDCVDRVDVEQNRIRANFSGWFNYQQQQLNKDSELILLKPNKKVFLAACCGHQWQGNSRSFPSTLSLRELLLSCEINWSNFRINLPPQKLSRV